MDWKTPKRIVIDASIAHACGGPDTTHPTGKNCRDFLLVILDVSHLLVLTPAITAEWEKHESPFARTWRTEITRRGKIYRPHEVPELFREAIIAIEFSENERKAVLKDCLLIDAAIAAEHNIVTSLDEEVRALLAQSCTSVVDLQNIVWVNPDKVDEKPILWLKAGAKSEKKRRLGFRR